MITGTVIIHNATKQTKSTAREIGLLDIGNVVADKLKKSEWENDEVTIEWIVGREEQPQDQQEQKPKNK